MRFISDLFFLYTNCLNGYVYMIFIFLLYSWLSSFNDLFYTRSSYNTSKNIHGNKWANGMHPSLSSVAGRLTVRTACSTLYRYFIVIPFYIWTLATYTPETDTTTFHSIHAQYWPTSDYFHCRFHEGVYYKAQRMIFRRIQVTHK